MPDKNEKIKETKVKTTKTENPKTETKKAEVKKTDTPKTEEKKVEVKTTKPQKEESKKETVAEKSEENKVSKRHPLYLDMTKWSLRKVAFLTVVALGVLHLISAFLALFNLQSIVSGLQAVASAIATAIVAVLSWSYAAERNKEWKIIYFICLLVVIVGIILPLVF